MKPREACSCAALPAGAQVATHRQARSADSAGEQAGGRAHPGRPPPAPPACGVPAGRARWSAGGCPPPSAARRRPPWLSRSAPRLGSCGAGGSGGGSAARVERIRGGAGAAAPSELDRGSLGPGRLQSARFCALGGPRRAPLLHALLPALDRAARLAERRHSPSAGLHTLGLGAPVAAPPVSSATSRPPAAPPACPTTVAGLLCNDAGVQKYDGQRGH